MFLNLIKAEGIKTLSIMWLCGQKERSIEKMGVFCTVARYVSLHIAPCRILKMSLTSKRPLVFNIGWQIV